MIATADSGSTHERGAPRPAGDRARYIRVRHGGHDGPGRGYTCRLGLFVAPGGFTGPFKDNLRAERRDSAFVILLGREALEGLITSPNRNAYLKDLHTEALVDQTGD